MSTRCKIIEEDVRLAKERFLWEDGLDAGPSRELAALELDEDTVVFQVVGVDGDFTAFLADPYPSEESAVYGPDDFELKTTGCVAEIVLAVLSKLTVLSSRHDACSDDGSQDEMTWIVTDRPPEPALQADLDSARRLFGEDGVTITQLCADTYRVRLYVPVDLGFLDSRVRSAWGLKSDLPICIDLCLPSKGYAFGSVEPSMLKQVRQEGFSGFGLEKQILQILSDFCVACRRPSGESVCEDFRMLPEETSEMLRQKYEAKKQSLILRAMAARDLGFLSCLGQYLQLRMPTLHEFCAICDSPFLLPPMMMRSVCPRELCTYQFGEFGSKITSAEGMNNHAEIVDLLVCMLMAAATSPRRHLILDPFPNVYVGEELRVVLHPNNKDFSKLETYVGELQGMRSRVGNDLGASWSACTSQMTPEAAGLLKWTVASNRSFLAPLQEKPPQESNVNA